MNIFATGRIGMLPTKDIVFKNLGGAASGATQAYNTAIAQQTTANDNWTKIKAKLTGLDDYFNPLHQYIMDNNWQPVIKQVLGEEGYGDAFYTDRLAKAKYKLYIYPKQMRGKTRWTSGVISPDWECMYNDCLVTANQSIINGQKEIVEDWKEAMKLARKTIKEELDTAAGVVAEKARAVSDAKIQLDAAIKAEGIASDQRIKEKEKDPAYIKAKADADRIIIESGIKQKRNRNILILGLATIAVIGGIIVLTKKK